MPATPDEEKQFVRAVNAAMVWTDDALEVDWATVFRLVFDDPETTAKITRLSLDGAGATPRLFRIAEILAAAHEAATDDDSLVEAVEVARVRLGRSPTRLRSDDGEVTLRDLFRQFR